jgi:hypothetical protein
VISPLLPRNPLLPTARPATTETRRPSTAPTLVALVLLCRWIFAASVRPPRTEA